MKVCFKIVHKFIQRYFFIWNVYLHKFNFRSRQLGPKFLEILVDNIYSIFLNRKLFNSHFNLILALIYLSNFTILSSSLLWFWIALWRCWTSDYYKNNKICSYFHFQGLVFFSTLVPSYFPFSHHCQRLHLCYLFYLFQVGKKNSYQNF